jgi:hypothetical protein
MTDDFDRAELLIGGCIKQLVDRISTKAPGVAFDPMAVMIVDAVIKQCGEGSMVRWTVPRVAETVCVRLDDATLGEVVAEARELRAIRENAKERRDYLRKRAHLRLV